jgi:hypothetical protein
LTRYHPDGTFSHNGVVIDGEVMPGTTYVLQRSKNKTTELALVGEPAYKAVFRMEKHCIRKKVFRWRNFDAKGRRITLEGELLPSAEQYAKNFPGFSLPETLASLIEFQNDYGIENFAEGFAALPDDQGLLKGFCGPEGRLVSRAKDKQFLAALMPLATANGTGSGYFLWNDGGTKRLDEMPVLIFGDEGGHHVVAENLKCLLQIVGADVEPMVDWDEVSYYKTPDHEPSAQIRAYTTWLKETVGVAAAKKPELLVRQAQRKHKRAFDAWLGTLR